MAQERPKTLWILAIMGVLGFALISMMMVLTLESTKEKPGINKPEIASQVRTYFGFELAEAEVGQQDLVLVIRYTTEPARPLPADMAERQINEVLEYVTSEFSEDLKVRGIRVHRREISKSGCSTSIQTSFVERSIEQTKPNPYDYEE